MRIQHAYSRRTAGIKKRNSNHFAGEQKESEGQGSDQASDEKKQKNLLNSSLNKSGCNVSEAQMRLVHLLQEEGLQVEVEQNIEDVLVVDILVEDAIVVEYDGPFHFYRVVQEKGEIKSCENGHTMLRDALLRVLTVMFAMLHLVL